MLTRRTLASTAAAATALTALPKLPAQAASPPYVAVGHHAFYHDELPEGVMPIYDMDPDTRGLVVSE